MTTPLAVMVEAAPYRLLNRRWPCSANIKKPSPKYLYPNKETKAMKSILSPFARQYLGVVAASVLPVVLTAFLSIPLSLGGHPGEARVAQDAGQMHMS
jgi:hypothetical protein